MHLTYAAVAAIVASAAAVPMPLAPSLANCTCLPSAKDADLITALGWVCGPAGKVDCSPINTGGSHFFPNDAVDHANYAFTEFYHANAASGYDTCFCKQSFAATTEDHLPSTANSIIFPATVQLMLYGVVYAVGGNAAVHPSPVGHWLFVQGGALDYPYPTAKEGIGLWDTIPSGKSTTYVTDTFNGKFQALPGGFSSTIFSLWMAATTAPTDVHVEIYYLLPCGSALPRYRREWYNKMTLAAAPKYEAYTNALGFAEPPVGTFCPGVAITGAKMNVTVTALPGGAIAFIHSTLPSSLSAYNYMYTACTAMLVI